MYDIFLAKSLKVSLECIIFVEFLKVMFYARFYLFKLICFTFAAALCVCFVLCLVGNTRKPLLYLYQSQIGYYLSKLNFELRPCQYFLCFLDILV